MKKNWYALAGLIASAWIATIIQGLQTILPPPFIDVGNVTAIVGATISIIAQLTQPAAKVMKDATVVNDTGEEVAVLTTSPLTTTYTRPPTTGELSLK
jgi:hypothetical protein